MPESRWPLTLVRRGKRLGAHGDAADYEWWMEMPPGETAEGLRSVGYEVIEVAPADVREAARLRGELLRLIDAAERCWPHTATSHQPGLRDAIDAAQKAAD